jgi:RnfABCDGE-type electron transport complex B subunit
MLTNVLTALAVVVSVGAFFAILLAVFTELFGVEENEKTKQIRAVLPGINCGACGFKGCNDYADALANGKAKPNLCIPGSKATADEIGEILGIEVPEPKAVVAFVRCNGTCDATLEKAIYEGIDSCKAKYICYHGPKFCSYGCLGCGECAKICISDAINIFDGIAHVDADLCIGCGLCAKECPTNIISMVPKDATTVVCCSSKDRGADARKFCKNSCIACKKCEKACPNQAITVIDNCAVIDYSKCDGCGLCAEGCPTKCIKNVKLQKVDDRSCFAPKI